jgi:hypothetical protein
MTKLWEAAFITITGLVFLSSVLEAKNNCQNPALLHQRRDVATIESLELEWTHAYLRGDTDFEECLLTPDFTEIMRNGDIKDLAAELALAAKNKTNPLPLGDLPRCIECCDAFRCWCWCR